MSEVEIINERPYPNMTAKQLHEELAAMCSGRESALVFKKADGSHYALTELGRSLL
jgi:hypothetical protein